MKYANVALFTDLDGTLVDSRSRVPEKNREAIRRFAFQKKENSERPEDVRSFENGDPSETRTPDPLLKRQLLYRLS